MRTRRTPFYGTPEDRDLLPREQLFARDELAAIEPDMLACMGDGMTEGQARELIPGAVKPLHPDYCEKGIELPLGLVPHKGENRRTRRAAVANWTPPQEETRSMEQSIGRDIQTNGAVVNGGASAPAPAERMPTRRELLKQRQRQRRGKLDIETRRLQRERIKNGKHLGG
jgi:hypothetical protein